MDGIDDTLSKSNLVGCDVGVLVSGDCRRFASFRLLRRAIGVLTTLDGELMESLKYIITK
jgi:hypothetical protein